MKCKICNNSFHVKRHFLDFFKKENYYICDRCLKEYLIKINYESFSFDEYDVVVITMFDKKHNIDFNYFQKEYSKLFEVNFNREGFVTLFIDEVDIINEMELLYNLTYLNESNVIIFCFNLTE